MALNRRTARNIFAIGSVACFVALALLTGAPILVAETVLDKSAIANESDEDEELLVFKQFIEQLPDEEASP